MSTVEAFVAASRFGLGARPGTLEQISGDPHTWLRKQLSDYDGANSALEGLTPSRAILEQYQAARGNRDARKKFTKEVSRPNTRREFRQRMLAAVTTDTPFRERLVRFWSNHFTISTTRGRIRKVAGAYEREAIRPHVTGNFADLLLAVVRHPAMLSYLDNVSSMGPKSKVGRKKGRGLNENLAREILELHTVGVNGGYTQRDVVELARLLTGWGIAGANNSRPGTFRFRADRHDPGPKQLLGRKFTQGGEAGGEAALRMLAAHPSTARFIANKLARHFVSDDPPASAVRNLERVFIERNGDLAALYNALIDLPEAWDRPLAKIKTPDELAVSAFRLLGAPKQQKHLTAPLRLLGQVPFSAPSPAGWPDEAAEWISPESVLRRIEVMQLIAKRYGSQVSPIRVADEAFAPVAMEPTVNAIRRAPSRQDAMALVLASREFQRR